MASYEKNPARFVPRIPTVLTAKRTPYSSTGVALTGGLFRDLRHRVNTLYANPVTNTMLARRELRAGAYRSIYQAR